MPDSVILKVKMLCHPALTVRLSASTLIPRERYERRCNACGFEWTITRTLIGNREAARMDKLEWQASHYVYSQGADA